MMRWTFTRSDSDEVESITFNPETSVLVAPEDLAVMIFMAADDEDPVLVWYWGVYRQPTLEDPAITWGVIDGVLRFEQYEMESLTVLSRPEPLFVPEVPETSVM